MLIKRVQPMSLGKILGVLYAVLGLLIGIIFSLVSLAFPAALGSGSPQQTFPGWSLLFGAGAVIVLPIFYGVLGFLGGLIAAGLYNGLSRFVGGVVIEVE